MRFIAQLVMCFARIFEIINRICIFQILWILKTKIEEIILSLEQSDFLE